MFHSVNWYVVSQPQARSLRLTYKTAEIQAELSTLHNKGHFMQPTNDSKGLLNFQSRSAQLSLHRNLVNMI